MQQRPILSRGLAVCLVLLASLALPKGGHALPIDPAEFGASFAAFAGVTTPVSEYDASSQTYSVNGVLGSESDSANLFVGDFTSAIATDLVGTFSLTAQVDEFGTLSTGSYSWFGGSASLGIDPGTELLSGTLSEVGVEQGPVYYIQSLGSVDVIDPVFSATVGPFDELLIVDYQIIPGWDVDPWGSSYRNEQSFTGGPDLLGRPMPVPEPSILALLAVGLAGMGLTRRRRVDNAIGCP